MRGGLRSPGALTYVPVKNLSAALSSCKCLLCCETCQPALKGYFVRYEVFTAVTMKNVVFCDIKPQFVPHRKRITSPLQSSICYYYVSFEVFTAVTMKNVVFWDIKPSSYFTGDTLRLHYRAQPVNAM
jgi:hypothetical protein